MTTFKASSIARSQKPMKRSGFKPTAVQMKRSGFTWKRPEKMKRTRMKSRRKPMTKIQASARGEACTIRLPGICMNRTETTVLCHSNQHSDGKGMGLKAPDQCAAYGCFECHAVVDGPRAATGMDVARSDAGVLPARN